MNSSLLCSILVHPVSIIATSLGELHIQFELLLDLGVGSKFALWRGHVVNAIVEGATHGGRLRRQRNIERLDAHNLDEQLAVSLSSPFLSSEFFNLFRVFILAGASANVFVGREGG